MNWVYSTGRGKPKQVPTTEQTEPEAGFSSSLFGLDGSVTSQQTAPPPQPVVDEADYLEVVKSGTMLSILTADVDVKPDPRLFAELHRSTKKNPPRTLKYELTYVCHPHCISY